MKKFIVDRFEEEYAVLEKEEGGTVDVLQSELPEVKEGDILTYESGVFTVDCIETIRRKELIREKMRKLFEKK